MPWSPQQQNEFNERRAADAQRAIRSLTAAVAALPELRIGQIIENAKYRVAPDAADLFYIENDVLAHALDEYVVEQARFKRNR